MQSLPNLHLETRSKTNKTRNERLSYTDTENKSKKPIHMNTIEDREKNDFYDRFYNDLKKVNKLAFRKSLDDNVLIKNQFYSKSKNDIPLIPFNSKQKSLDYSKINNKSKVCENKIKFAEKKNKAVSFNKSTDLIEFYEQPKSKVLSEEILNINNKNIQLKNEEIFNKLLKQNDNSNIELLYINKNKIKNKKRNIFLCFF